MVTAVTNGVGSVIDYVGDTITAIMSGAWSALLPVIGLGVGVVFVVYGVRFVKSLIKGY